MWSELTGDMNSPDIDVYILTSRNTFSAAEEFSYNLKNLERATLVGETTGGGAHPGGLNIVSDRFMVWMP
jgi:retinol-binding protein 3